MKVAGMVPGTKETRVALVEGFSGAPTRVDLSVAKLKTPRDPREHAVLQSMLRLASTWFEEQTPDRVVLLAAGSSQFRANSKLRTKVEAVIQLACAQLEIECQILAPQTLRAREKRFRDDVGTTVEASLNSGVAFTPKPLRNAVLTAWCGLPVDAS